VLDWKNLDKAAGQQRLKLVRDLLALREKHIVPRLRGARFGAAAADDNGILKAHWKMGDGAMLHLLANLSTQAVASSHQTFPGNGLWGSDVSDVIEPWSVRWRMEDAS
jgi:maltooligosyltrehalose trehalohydrolase